VRCASVFNGTIAVDTIVRMRNSGSVLEHERLERIVPNDLLAFLFSIPQSDETSSAFCYS